MDDDEDGLTVALCTTRPEFRELSEDDVLAAVANDDYGESPITAEVTRLGVEFMARFRAYVEEHGYFEPRIMQADAQCPIEKVAILTVVRFVEVHRGRVGVVAVH